MVGEPALPDGFTALPYANPDAPKGGTIRFAEPGSFDSLKPWVLKGNAVWAVGNLVAETLMFRSIDEPFSLYGLLAESVETDPERTWVEFTLRPEATVLGRLARHGRGRDVVLRDAGDQGPPPLRRHLGQGREDGADRPPQRAASPSTPPTASLRC